MNIFVDGYCRNNLGDDLFFLILFDRYKNCNFTLIDNHYNYSLRKYKNVKIYNTKFINLLNKFIKNKIEISRLIEKKCDLSILIGGSLFMQKDENFFAREYSNDYLVLGSNFGPYFSQNFVDFYFNFFSKALDVCFRDSYSLSLFKNLQNVRSCPDIIFSLNTEKYCKKSNKSVIISVIDVEKRKNLCSIDVYEKILFDIIEKYTSFGYKIILMSFCKAEGDERAINRFYKNYNLKCYNNISKYFYRGNIDKALNIISSSEVIVGSRFHANILGFLFEKNVLPILYSDKMKNVLNDLDFEGEYIDLRKSNNKKVEFKFKKIKNKEDIVKKSEKQFIILDKIINS